MAEISLHSDFSDNPTLFEDADIRAIGFSHGAVEIERGQTAFVAVGAGEFVIEHATRCPAGFDHWIGPGMYASVPGPARISGEGCALVALHKWWTGMFTLGGPLEDAGRLRYIDGCTDTGLIQPPRQGDPCLNYLHFPDGIRQTEHTHPSHRVGLIFEGSGLCHTPELTHEMRPRSIFVLPTGTKHFFETFGDTMRIIVFHPDSDFGPTDESHQMLNATLIER